MSNRWEDYETNGWDDMTDLIISMMCRQVDPMAPDLPSSWQRIDASEVHMLKGGRSNSVWQQVVDAADNLSTAGLRFRDKEGKRAHFFGVIDEVMVKGTTIYAKFKPGPLKELVLHHRKNYANARMKALAPFRGHARMLYKRLVRFDDTGYRTISYNELRLKLGIEEGQYDPFSKFKEKILERCKARFEKNPYCHFTFDYQVKGRGKNVRAITFLIRPRTFLDDSPAKPPTPEEIESVRNEIREVLHNPTPPDDLDGEEWIVWIKEHRPHEYRDRYNAENVIARSALFDSTEDEIHGLTERRMIRQYLDQVASAQKRHAPRVRAPYGG